MSAKQTTMKDDLQNLARWLFLVYVFTGAIATAWISAEFDRERIFLTAVVGIPAFSLYLLLRTTASNWHERYVVFHKLLLTTILLAFAWGNLLLLNAASGEVVTENSPVPTVIGRDAVDLAQRKGALGIYYETRW